MGVSNLYWLSCDEASGGASLPLLPTDVRGKERAR